MKKKNNKNKVLKKKGTKKEIKKSYKQEGKNVLFGFLGFLLTIFLVQLSYKGSEETLNLNLVQVVDFFSAQIYYLLGLPKTITTILGVIVLIIPPVFFYFFSKEVFGKKK